MPDSAKELFRAQILKRLTWVDSQLAGKDYLTGAQFTVADGYLFTVCGWTKFVGIDVSALANLGKFLERVGARPAVQKAIADEKQ